MNTRVYDEKIDINYSSTKSFWASRADESLSLKSVLLGVDKKSGAQEERNKIKSVLKNLTFDVKKLRPIEEAIVTSGGVKVSEIKALVLFHMICQFMKLGQL